MTDTANANPSASGLPAGFPPVVYVPCAEHVQDVADARPLMQRTRDGRLALMVYSALDRLHDGCGPNHPWFVVSTPALEAVHRTQQYDLILLDILVPEEHRMQGSSDG